MPEKFFCCLSLSTGANLIGVIQTIAVTIAIGIALGQYKGLINSPFNYGTSIMITVGFGLPMIAWFTTLASDSSCSKKFYAIAYFSCHFVVEAINIAVPIYYLGQYWNYQPQGQQVDNNGDQPLTVR